MPSRRTVLVSSAASLLAAVLPATGLGAEDVERLPMVASGPRGHGRLKPGQQPADPYSPKQTRAPRAPEQFNPDPGSKGTTPAVPAPAPRPRVTPPELSPAPRPNAPPSPQPA